MTWDLGRIFERENLLKITYYSITRTGGRVPASQDQDKLSGERQITELPITTCTG